MATQIINSTLKPKDQVIQYIRRALQSGELQPNTKLPSERNLAEMFDISRSAVREALKTLETYGIIKTLPQSGSVIVGLDISAIDGLLSDVLRLDAFDFGSLAEMRMILEVNSARFCAMRRTEQDLKEIREALNNYIEVYKGQNAEEIAAADFAYHRSIVTGSKNSVLRSMLMLISPDILYIYKAENICQDDANNSFSEHQEIYQSLVDQDFNKAAQLMADHLKRVLDYAQDLREKGLEN
ncbi:MAG: FadR/GntR family transcriptional regulator [Rikenellaceae bacterium]